MKRPPTTPTHVGLPLSQTTLADRLKAAGYKTGWVGKWHLGSELPFIPQNRGFEDSFGFLGGSHGYFSGTKPPLRRNNEPIQEKEYLTDAFGREAVSFIERHEKEPFFLYLAFNAVHTPMNATDDRLEKFKDISDKNRRTYAGMMSAMDDSIGRVLKTLREERLEDNTLVFFFSDNGGWIATGMNANLRTIGSAIGAALMTAMVTGATQPNGLPAESGYSEGFLTAGLLAFGAAIVTGVALLIARPRRATVVETLVTTPESPFAESEVEAEADFELQPEAELEPEAESPLDTARERELEPALR